MGKTSEVSKTSEVFVFIAKKLMTRYLSLMIMNDNIDYLDNYILRYKENLNNKSERRIVFKQYLEKLEYIFRYLDNRSILSAASSISVWFGAGYEVDNLWDWLKKWIISVDDNRIKVAISVGCIDLISEPPVNAKMLQFLFGLLSEPKAHWAILSAYELRKKFFYTHFEFFVKFQNTIELQDVLKG